MIIIILIMIIIIFIIIKIIKIINLIILKHYITLFIFNKNQKYDDLRFQYFEINPIIMINTFVKILFLIFLINFDKYLVILFF